MLKQTHQVGIHIKMSHIPGHINENSLLEPLTSQENIEAEANLFGSNISKVDRKEIDRQLNESLDDVRTRWRAGRVSPYYQGSRKGHSTIIDPHTIADIVEIHKPGLAKAYENLFKARSSFMNVFGRKKTVDAYGNTSGKGGWSFPLINKVRGKMLANRYEKGLRKGGDPSYDFSISGILGYLKDSLPGMGGGKGITAWAYPDRLQGSTTWIGETEDGKQVPVVTGAGGELQNDYSSMLNKSDAEAFYAVLNPTYTSKDIDENPKSPTYRQEIPRQHFDTQKLLNTILHEGGHYQTLFGETLHHGDPALSQQTWRGEFGTSIDSDQASSTHGQSISKFPTHPNWQKGGKQHEISDEDADRVRKLLDDIVYRSLSNELDTSAIPEGFEFDDKKWKWFKKGHVDEKGELIYLDQQELYDLGRQELQIKAYHHYRNKGY